MKILVIPDVHLKLWMFDRASEIMKSGAAEKAVCLMDIPDDWGKEYNLELYEDTFDAAIRFQKEFPDTLWCYGNHDLSYEWLQYESGFSSVAISVVNEKLGALRRELPDKSQMAYIHRIDNVLFLHGGLTHAFVKYYAPDVDYEDTDAVIDTVNCLGRNEMWDDASPIWFRPQFYNEKMYREDEILQVVGHTPVMQIDRMKSKPEILYELMIRKGYPEEFSRLICAEMNTDFTAEKMISYIGGGLHRLEDVADEMVAIKDLRDRLINKHISEHAQVSINKLYREINE